MATYQQDDDPDGITHIDVLNLLRQDMREGLGDNLAIPTTTAPLAHIPPTQPASPRQTRGSRRCSDA